MPVALLDVSHEPWVDDVIKQAVDAAETRRVDALIKDIEDGITRYGKMREILKDRLDDR